MTLAPSFQTNVTQHDHPEPYDLKCATHHRRPTPVATAAAVVCVFERECVLGHSHPQESQHACSTRVSSLAPFLDLSPFLEQPADILVTCAPHSHFHTLCADVRGHLLALDAAKLRYAAAFACAKQQTARQHLSTSTTQAQAAMVQT